MAQEPSNITPPGWREDPLEMSSMNQEGFLASRHGGKVKNVLLRIKSSDHSQLPRGKSWGLRMAKQYKSLDYEA